jgi:hypothetical protein
MNKFFIVIALSVFFAGTAYAQKIDTVKNRDRRDSINRVKDSVISKPIIPQVISKKNRKQYNPDSTHSPSLAVKRSAMIPGWGQLYNREWWKVPLIYGGLGSLGYFIVHNQVMYKRYLEVYKLRESAVSADKLPPIDDPVRTLYDNTKIAGLTSIENAVNNSQRNMQISVLSFAVVWGVQVVEAYIQAKFIHSYTMDRDLSFKISPGLSNAPVYAAGNIPSVMPTIKLTFTLK